jgi:hypothetical protein
MLDRPFSLVQQAESELGELLLQGHDLGFQTGKFLDQVPLCRGGGRLPSSRRIRLCLVCRQECCLLLW